MRPRHDRIVDERRRLEHEERPEEPDDLEKPDEGASLIEKGLVPQDVQHHHDYEHRQRDRPQHPLGHEAVDRVHDQP